MSDDVRKYIYGALIVFVVGVSIWVGFIFVNACGFSLTCNRGAIRVDHTPIPTLSPATLPVVKTGGESVTVPERCLLRRWIWSVPGLRRFAGTKGFAFTDVNGQPVNPPLKRSNRYLWKPIFGIRDRFPVCPAILWM